MKVFRQRHEEDEFDGCRISLFLAKNVVMGFETDLVAGLQIERRGARVLPTVAWALLDGLMLLESRGMNDCLTAP